MNRRRIRSKPHPFGRYYRQATRHQAISDWELCPVSKVAGLPHFFKVEDGVLVNWDVMGDPRSHMFVCPDCAVHAT